MSNMDLFETRSAQAMLLSEGNPFDSIDYIYELKLDGIRCLAYLDHNQTELRNKRNKNVTALYPELGDMHTQVNNKCILDGELIVTVNGVPDFYEIQRRSLMTNSFKIELTSKNKPVSFVCYDLLYMGNEELTRKPLMERKRILNQLIIKENQFLSLSRYIEEKGIDFYHVAENKKLEGVVAKKKSSYYYMGKRTKEWLKFKKMLDEDFVICGYVMDENKIGIKSLILGAYNNHKLSYQGHVSLGIPKNEMFLIMEYANTHKMKCPFETDEVGAVWIEPDLVCSVKFMMRTHSNTLRQPVYKGLRDDKDPMDCQIK